MPYWVRMNRIECDYELLCFSLVGVVVGCVALAIVLVVVIVGFQVGMEVISMLLSVLMASLISLLAGFSCANIGNKPNVKRRVKVNFMCRY